MTVRRRRLFISAAAACASGLVLIGCRAVKKELPIAAEVWATGPSDRVGGFESPRVESPNFDRGTGVIRLSSAVNETIGFSFVISATKEAASGLEIRAEDLVGPECRIPPTAIRVYRPFPVVVERYPNWFLRTQGLRESRAYPDALVPIPVNGVGPEPGSIAAQPLVILAGQSLALYVEITIPPEARPGRYKTAISLVGANRKPLPTSVEILVRDVYLSDELRLPIVASVQLGPIIAGHTDLDPENIRLGLTQAESRAAIEKAFALLHEHGLSPYCHEVYPRFSQDADGKVVLDWSEYDAFCGPFIDGSAFADERKAFAWPLPVSMTQPHPSQYDGMDSSAYANILDDYLRTAGEHFAEKEWLGRSFVHFEYPRSVNADEADLERVRRLLEITHRANEKLDFLTTLIPQPMAAFGWYSHRFVDLTDQVDIWATPARYAHPSTLAQLQMQGKLTWLLPDRPPYSGSLAVEAPLTHARSLAWQAFLQGHEAIWLPKTTQWPTDVFNRAITDDSQSSDTWLMYPGKIFGIDGPVPSVRLKMLQAGIQEYQYLRLLREHGRAATAELLASSLIKAAGTDAYGDHFQDGLWDRRIDDPDVWELAAFILREETELAVSENPVEPVNIERNRGDWYRLLAATRSLDAWVRSAKIQKDPRKKGTGYLAMVDVVVRNELRTSVEGALKFGLLPPEATPIDDSKNIGPLAEMDVASRSIVAHFPQPPACDLDGHYIQPIVFETVRAPVAETQATFSITRVSEVSTPPAIDGRLDDWPPGTLNVVGDFRLIAFAQGTARRRAESQTIAYTCTDGQRLFIGIQAMSPAERVAAPVESNVIDYEDLRPVGSDLVEILIDPTGAAKRIEDIYHVVVKSTGDPVFERGVSVTPPIGAVAPWPGPRPEYSVTWGPQGWTAEIALSLESFEPQGSRNAVWGFNLARLEPLRGEYSDWARAQRYCYDPASFGNLVWPESTFGK